MTPEFTRQRQQQSLATGMLGGLLAAFVGAVIWTTVTAVTHYQVGWMAVLLGMAVGTAVRLVGHGVDRVFQITAAALALVGCVFGNLLTDLIQLAPTEGVPVLGLFLHLTPYRCYWILMQTFHPLDMLFYWLAVRTAYALSVVRYQAGEVLPLQPHTTPV